MSGYLQLPTGLYVPERDDIEQLRAPKSWDDFRNETAEDIKAKVDRAEQVGAMAIIATERQVDDRIADMAAYERSTYFDEIRTQQFFYLSLLNGGAKFGQQFIDLVANGKKYSTDLPIHPLSAFLHVSTRDGDQEIKEAEIFNRLKTKDGHDVAGKDIVILDDGTDTGTSMNMVAELLLDPEAVEKYQLGTGPAKSVTARFLTDKGISELKPELVVIENIVIGFNCPVAWLGGMGFDGRDQAQNLTDVGRNLREIVLTQAQNTRYREKMPKIIKTLGPRTRVKDIDNDFFWINVDKTAA